MMYSACFTAGMATDSETRLEMLIDVCLSRGWVNVRDPRRPSPTKLAQAIDREVNYCSDLLKGSRSFGEEIARHIEDRLALPRYFLDGVVAVNTGSSAGWPFPGIDKARFDALDPMSQGEIQGKVREMIARFEADKGNAAAA